MSTGRPLGSSVSSGSSRRRFILGSSAAVLSAASVSLRAQTGRRYAVVSLVGNQLDVVYAQMTTGTHLDPNVHRIVPDPNGAMDKFALAAVSRALDQGGQGSAELLSLAPSPLHEQGETLSDDRTVALPASVVQALEQAQATHLVLLTKQRAEANIPLRSMHLGTGLLSGLGYYIDITPHLRMVDSGTTGRGLIAPYAYLKLTLADVQSGAVLSQRRCTVSRPYAVAASKTAVDPWSVLSDGEKVDRLRRLLEQAMAREVPLLVAA